MSIVLDYNPLTRETVTMELVDDKIVIGHEQDCTPIIEHNKRQVIESSAAAQMKNDWIKYATVPNIVILKWKRELGVDFFNRDHSKKVMQLLNSADYSALKTTTITHDR